MQITLLLAITKMPSKIIGLYYSCSIIIPLCTFLNPCLMALDTLAVCIHTYPNSQCLQVLGNIVQLSSRSGRTGAG